MVGMYAVRTYTCLPWSGKALMAIEVVDYLTYCWSTGAVEATMKL
jgi:hypothetical protein